MKNLSCMGEQYILDWIGKFFGQKSPGVIVPPGDDCAVLKGSEEPLLLTTDSMVEGVHFQQGWLSPTELGRRAMVQNISDIAAMGGRPSFAVVSMMAPPDMLWRDFRELARGLKEGAEEYNCAIVGGNLSRAKELALGITLLGRGENFLLRRGAKVGHTIWVTGFLGGPRAGWLALEKGWDHSVIESFRRPHARVEEAIFLKKRVQISAMMDVSDGLKTDLPRLLKGLGGKIDITQLALSSDLIDFCDQKKLDPLEMAMLGGEDFELLFASEDSTVEHWRKEFQERFQIPLSPIGTVIQGDEIVWLDGDGRPKPPKEEGFEHF